MKTQFHPKQLQSLMYNVDKVPEGTDVLTFYKDLGRIKEFKVSAGEGIDNNKLMIYIILMYDKASPYRTKFTDVLKRKIEVAHDAGFETIEGGNFESPVEDFLKGRNRIVNQKVIRFVMLHRNYKYAYQISVEATYFNLMLEIQAGDTKSITKLKDLRDELEDNLHEMLNQDSNPYLKDEILRYLEDERLALRPEDFAKRAQEGSTK
jgi:hypothetical protein